jgi:hypothetical protein
MYLQVPLVLPIVWMETLMPRKDLPIPGFPFPFDFPSAEVAVNLALLGWSTLVVDFVGPFLVEPCLTDRAYKPAVIHPK